MLEVAAHLSSTPSHSRPKNLVVRRGSRGGSGPDAGVHLHALLHGVAGGKQEHLEKNMDEEDCEQEHLFTTSSTSALVLGHLHQIVPQVSELSYNL